MTGIEVKDKASGEKAGRWLVDRVAGVAIITLGKEVAVAVREGESELFKPREVEAVDTTGAGDVAWHECRSLYGGFWFDISVELESLIEWSGI